MTMDALQKSINQRWLPETVAKTILETAQADGVALNKRASDRLRRAKPRWGFSSMASDYRRAVGMERQLKVAGDLFPAVPRVSAADPSVVRNYIDTLYEALHFDPQNRDFLNGRLNREKRQAQGLARGHRAYNKRFRLLARMAERFTQWQHTRNMTDLAQIAKSRLASRIAVADLTDPYTTYFCAYFAAKLGVRSAFTWGAQSRPYDVVCESLMEHCTASASTNWFAIAHVYPMPEVIERLSDEQKGRLLGEWFDVMERAAKILGELAKDPGYDFHDLVVSRGNDSSTWNEAAGAFTKARDGWISSLYAMGMATVLDKFCPGKALRLMAADVVAMHRHHGSGGLEPDTNVWNAVPRPWDVMQGMRCTRADIEAACARHGIEGKGWVKPRPVSVAEYEPTPELVHGVIVASPLLATTLRRCGYFSGKHAEYAGVDIDKSLGAGGKTVVADEALGIADRLDA